MGLEDCTKISRTASALLDVADPFPGKWVLEVSSPGIERVLRKDKHFEAQIGNEIYLKLFKSVLGKKEIQGVLKEYTADVLTLEVDGDIIKIENKDIANARTIYNW